MLAMADTNLEQFLPLFAQVGAKVAFLSPTPTGIEKYYMDAISDVRALLKEQGIHDYSLQGKGQENKVYVKAYFVYSGEVIETEATLYRPKTKEGDPRIWFSGLNRYCNSRNLLALVVSDGKIFVINLSEADTARSLLEHGYVYDIVRQSVYESEMIARELLEKIFLIHKQGFLPSVTPGDPGVGDTLENALGISRNNIAAPDYKGIELKASRLTRGGIRRAKTRVNLFSKVPEAGMSYADIVRAYGKWTFNEKKQERRLSLENTTYASHPNSHGLILEVNPNQDQLHLCHVDEGTKMRYLSYWYLTNLRKQLIKKHHETFWVYANAIEKNGVEWFRYDTVVHTKNPNDLIFGPLIERDIITVDLVAHISEKSPNKCRDHGMLFKIWPHDLPLLFGEPVEYDLTKIVAVGRWMKKDLVP